MQDLLLIIILAATFLFGWLLMRKVDIFMEECMEEQDGLQADDMHRERSVLFEMKEKGRMCYNGTGWGSRPRRKPDGSVKTKPGSAPESNQ